MAYLTNPYKKLGRVFFASSPARMLQTLIEVRLSRGYNQFYYSKYGLLAKDVYTQTRGNILLPYFRESLSGRSVLDLGAANGYFSLLACLNGASEVLGIERDQFLRNQAQRAAQHMGFAQARFEDNSIYKLDASEQRDVILALAIIHWFLHASRPNFSSFAGILDYLGGLVRECLFVEYIAPEDPTFIQYPELAENLPLYESVFSKKEFVRCLEERFTSVKLLGESRQTRSLYMACR